MRALRVTAFPVRHLLRPDAFARSKEIKWSTGRNTAPGDIQATLGEHRELADDQRRDAVHSIWMAITPVKDEFAEQKWPVQAKFKLLVKLRNPVRKAALVRAGLLKGSWPRNSAGKLLTTGSAISTLGEVLARANPDQRADVFNALGLPLERAGRGPCNRTSSSNFRGSKRQATEDNGSGCANRQCKLSSGHPRLEKAH